MEGRDISSEFHWAENHPERLPAMAADLLRRQAAVIVTNFGAVAAAKAATKTVPIVFVTGDDPVTTGVVANLNRPGGNVTGISFFDVPLSGKRLGLLNNLIPKPARIAVLLDPGFIGAASERRELEHAALAVGRQISFVTAASEREIDHVFPAIVQAGAGALLVGAGPFFVRQRRRIIANAAQAAIPAIYIQREFVLSGGLMSYGASLTDAYRRAAGYVSRILKGEKPGDMPVELPTKFEFVINLKTAHVLGLAVPPTLLALADEVIE